jgi:hypothetical protein
MDSHIKGPAVNGYGAIAGQRGLHTKFGTTLAGAGNRRLLLKTQGAGAETPLIVELLQVQKTAFNGTAPEVAIVSENLDGSGAVTELAIANLAANQPPKYVTITVDRAYYVVYTAATGAPTAGDMYSFAKVSGMGPTS